MSRIPYSAAALGVAERQISVQLPTLTKRFTGLLRSRVFLFCHRQAEKNRAYTAMRDFFSAGFYKMLKQVQHNGSNVA